MPIVEKLQEKRWSPGCAGQVLVLSVRDVLPRPVVPVFLRQTEVYQEELVAVPSDAHEEVVRLDVAVDEVLVVHVLDPPDHLVRQHEHGLHGEPPGAEVEEVLKAGAKQVHDQHIVVALLPIPAYVGYPDTSLQGKYGVLSSLNVIGRAKGQKPVINLSILQPAD